jgi:peptidoglycan/xylan/chitin deacetylase (PgdA/CDA1 family)
MTRAALFALIFSVTSAWAQPPAVTEVAPAPPIGELEVPDDGVRVAVLGYHDLGENLPETAMRIHTSKFRKQMESIRQLGIPVIPMEEFISWKNGDRDIPKNAIVITFDDGWKSVYTDAYPILKELGFPFTIYLYKNYIDGGGKALTSAMIEEMKRNGATIGSHSVSHPYPVTVKSFRKKGAIPYDAYLRKEMGESKRFLEDKFRTKVTTYAYPGGFFTEEMIPLGAEFGYTQLFTVVPGKVKRSLPNETLPRYIILGNYDKIFEMAVTFREGAGPTDTLPSLGGSMLTPTTPYPVLPEAGAIINSRLPVISADLSQVENLDPATLSMKVGGFGEVPATFSAETQVLSWQVNRRLREPTCTVSITWKDTAGKANPTALRWSFQIDRESAYLPDGE